MLTSLRIMPRWFIFCLDLIVVAFAIMFSFTLRFNFDLAALNHTHLLLSFVITVAANMIAFWAFRNHIGIVRYTAMSDTIRLLQICVITNVFLWIVGRALVGTYPLLFPASVVVINFFLSFSLLFGYRLLVRAALQNTLRSLSKARMAQKAAIYGSGPEAVLAGQVFSSSPSTPFRLVAFVDSDRAKMRIVGLPVVAPTEESLKNLASQGVECILVPDYTSGGKELSDFLDLAFRSGIRNVRKLPPVQDWMDGKLQASQLQEIRIEDLLERAPIHIQNKKVLDGIQGKRILVTGAAGSIGSELVRQLIRLKPSAVILVDVAESPLHELLLELRDMQVPDCNVYPMIGDITDRSRMEYVFDIYHPDMVFHAAAYKHVPLMEDNPSIAVLNNVQGTRNIVELSVDSGVETFVLVSTDKAVNPTNVMGASKRIAEIYMQSLSNALSDLGKDVPHTKFITTRFGNVLGSNGSVIPRFKQQIAAGGPVTVTHPEITRFFMTIAEACQLVIEASAMGTGGEIFVFDMGKPVKVADLAEKMIRLSGKEPGKDIEISFTGLRPGEKLYEEVLATAEETMPTYHKKILIAKVRSFDLDTVVAQIDELVASAQMHYIMETVQKMKEIVPEFLSKNSPFERLDAVAQPRKQPEAPLPEPQPLSATEAAEPQYAIPAVSQSAIVSAATGQAAEIGLSADVSPDFDNSADGSGSGLFDLEPEPYEEEDAEDSLAATTPFEESLPPLNDISQPIFPLNPEPFEESVAASSFDLEAEPFEDPDTIQADGAEVPTDATPLVFHLEPLPFEEEETTDSDAFFIPETELPAGETPETQAADRAAHPVSEQKTEPAAEAEEYSAFLDLTPFDDEKTVGPMPESETAHLPVPEPAFTPIPEDSLAAQHLGSVPDISVDETGTMPGEPAPEPHTGEEMAFLEQTVYDEETPSIPPHEGSLQENTPVEHTPLPEPPRKEPTPPVFMPAGEANKRPTPPPRKVISAFEPKPQPAATTETIVKEKRSRGWRGAR